ncbi:MAG: zinc-binding dehydrogenase [Actinobacteria bacterium]|nr:zinc-binding dehydrogenase [Actinomycetota bacterium]
MRAAFFTGAGRMEVRETEMPPEPAPGDARLSIRYCGICGSDVSLFKSGILSAPDRIMGHELSAVVERDSTGRWAPGTRVTAWPARGCGQCLWCLEGHPRYCLNPVFGWGAYAESMDAVADYLVPIPDEMDDRTASLAEPLGVALRGVREAGVERGDLCFVLGLGSIGLLVLTALVDLGARVVGADIREDRRRLAEELGAELTFDADREDPFWKLLAVDLHGPRFAFECSGAPGGWQACLNTCGHMGTVVLLGIPFEPAFFIPAVMSVKEQRALSISGPTMDSMAGALEILARRPETARIITKTVPLDGTEQAFHDQVAGTGGVKVLVEPGA